MDEHVGAGGKLPAGARVANVAAKLLDRALELRVVQRRHVERAHADTLGREATGEMEPEEAGPAGDRDEHEPAYASGPSRRRAAPLC